MAFEKELLSLQAPEKLIPAHLEVVHLPYQRGGTFPGIFLYTESARMMRPVTHLATDASVLIGSLEQHVLNIRYDKLVIYTQQISFRLVLFVLSFPSEADA